MGSNPPQNTSVLLKPKNVENMIKFNKKSPTKPLKPPKIFLTRILPEWFHICPETDAHISNSNDFELDQQVITQTTRKKTSWMTKMTL